MTTACTILRQNVDVIKDVAQIMASSLGPAGKAKIFILPDGRKTITNNGKTILRMLPLENPVARFAADFVSSLEDGIKSAFVFANSLLVRTLKLAEQGMHPMNAIPIYQVCAGKAADFLLESGEKLWSIENTHLTKIVENVFHNKGIARHKRILAELLIKACQSVAEENLETDMGIHLDLSLITLFSQQQGHLDESNLIHGAVVRKGISYPLMPRRIENAGIVLLAADPESAIKTLLSRVRPVDATELQRLRKKSAYLTEKIVNTITGTGANVVVSKNKISHILLQKMSRQGILVVDQVGEADFERLCQAVGGRPVSILDSIATEDLGQAGLVREHGKAGNRFLVFTDCKNPSPVVLNIRAMTDYIFQNAADAVLNAAWQIKDIMESGMIVYGAGSIEAITADYLRSWAQNLRSIERIAAIEFAEAIEEIPRQLATNAGFSPSRIIAMMHDRRRKEGYPWWGVDINRGDIFDAKLANIADPLNRTRRYIETATQLVEMVIMFDEIHTIDTGFKKFSSAHMVTRPL